MFITLKKPLTPESIMINDFTPLNPSFVEALTPDQVDEVFIVLLLWGEEDDSDFIIIYTIMRYFLRYPGLDTWEKVYDKTWECIGKMLDSKLLRCGTLGDNDVSFEELKKDKDLIYRVMDDECTGEEMYKFIFEITDKGQEFLHEKHPKYQPIIDEIERLSRKSILDAEKKRELESKPYNPDLENPWTRLDSKSVEGLTPDQVDDIFITRLLWGEEDNSDFIIIYTISRYFMRYPGLDILWKVYDKTWECIEKMLDSKLLRCGTLGDNDVSFEELKKDKDLIYRVMDDEYVHEGMYKFIFEITDKGKDFLQENRPKYEHIIDELCYLTQNDIQHGQEEQASQN